MLQAQNGRQLNLAADVVRKFLTAKQFDLKHSEALQLVSQLIGYPSYHAARAGLQGVAKGVASDTSTWRHLAHAIGTLSEQQLDMPVQVSEGCDGDGNATFSKACELLMANADCISAGATIFADNQPVLLVEEFDPVLEGEDADRLRLQFEVATGEPCGLADREIKRHGLHGAAQELNGEYSLHIGLGKYLAYSEKEKGFWNFDCGFVNDKASATGFDSPEDLPKLAGIPDLEMVSYGEAVDVDPDADDYFTRQVRGEPVSQYQWPLRYDALWSSVSPRVSELLGATQKVVETKSFTTELVAREHVNHTGEQLTLEIFSPEKVFGGRLVFAFADGLRAGVVPAAALGVFLEIPERESIGHSLNIERNGAFPYATEADYFFEELLEQTPQKLAEALMLNANFDHKLSKN